MLRILPRRLQERLPVIKSRIRGTAAKYIRAYVILLLLTFIQLFVGFSLIGVSYPMLIAFLVALVDILPVLGVGTVLIPWGLIEITVSRDLYTGGGTASDLRYSRGGASGD